MLYSLVEQEDQIAWLLILRDRVALACWKGRNNCLCCGSRKWAWMAWEAWILQSFVIRQWYMLFWNQSTQLSTTNRLPWSSILGSGPCSVTFRWFYRHCPACKCAVGFLIVLWFEQALRAQQPYVCAQAGYPFGGHGEGATRSTSCGLAAFGRGQAASTQSRVDIETCRTGGLFAWVLVQRFSEGAQGFRSSRPSQNNKDTLQKNTCTFTLWSSMWKNCMGLSLATLIIILGAGDCTKYLDYAPRSSWIPVSLSTPILRYSLIGEFPQWFHWGEGCGCLSLSLLNHLKQMVEQLLQ